VVSAGAAALVLDILSDPVARIPGFGVETPFDFPFPVAVKTGTSHHFTDNWAVGVTGTFTVAVWAGNFSGRPMNDVSGVTGAGPLLHRAIMNVAKRYNPGTLQSPSAFGASRVDVCRLSGRLVTSNCSGIAEWFLPGTAPTKGDDWQTAGGGVTWPQEYAEWAEQTGKPASALGSLPNGTSGVAASAPGFEIVSPLDGDRYQIPPGMSGRYATIPLRVSGNAADEPIRWIVDGRPTRQTRWQLRPGTHEIRALAASGRSDQVRIEVQ
jgi:penicillin-binding protein 1C